MNEKPKGPFFEIKGTNVSPPYDTNPIEGYQIPINSKTKKPFPECCDRHIRHMTKVKEWFLEFPDCCDAHKPLKDKKWFKKEDYKDIPNKILNALSYTEYHIEKWIVHESWFEDITNYIIWTSDSFGGLGIGADRYQNLVLNYIESVQPITFTFPEEKRNKLVKFLKNYIEPKKKVKSNTDLNLLWGIYQRWLKAFPFEISFFAKMKEKAEKQLPLFCDAKYNPYSCITTFKVRTKEELITFLFDLTKLLMLRIDLKQMIEEGDIKDFDEKILELEVKNNRLKSLETFEQFEKGELKYRKAIKRWLRIQTETFQLFKASKLKMPKPLPSHSDKDVENKPSTASSFEKLFYKGGYPKVIHFLQKRNFIEVNKEDQSIQWIDDNEDDFAGFFWALFDLKLPNDKSFLIHPLPSNSHYQKLVFQTFQIINWKEEKFVKRNRHSLNVKASINNFKDELEIYLFPSQEG